jgi:hypothetical protein
MSDNQKKRGLLKFAFWTLATVILVLYVLHTYNSGQMTRWYYYRTDMDGYAINVKYFQGATKENPAVLKIVKDQVITGLTAVPVRKGDRLPEGANGVISNKILTEGKRARVEGDTVIVTVPWEIKESKGFKYKDRFIHKGVKTNPWSGVWNLAAVIGLGLCLGMMAEGATDVFGLNIKKIEHFSH